MPLNLIHGPPNSGRAGQVRRRFVAALDRDPVLVVPTLDDVFAFERELCEGGAALGGTVMTFGALFRTVATAGGAPPGPELSAVQRLRAVTVAVEARLGGLGPLRRSASRSGFPRAFTHLLDELQAASLGPAAVEAGAATLEGSAYLGDIAAVFAGYAEARERTGRVDAEEIAREAIDLLRRDGSFWEARPVFLYGLDDLTPSQLELVEALAGLAEVTVALPFEAGNTALAARSSLLGQLRDRVGVTAETETEADPGNTESPLLFHLARGFGRADAEPVAPNGDLRLLRSAGVRGEAEAIATEVSKLVAGGVDPAEIAVALRDPARRGPAIAAALEANGVATALEAELPVAQTAVGGALTALLEAEFGTGRASDLLRYLRGPSGFSPGRVDWLERSLRQRRVEDAATALELWQGEDGGPPRDLVRLRAAAARSTAALAAEAGRIAATMAARPLRGEGDGPPLAAGDGLELRAAGAVADALAELAELGNLAPRPEQLAMAVAALEFRVWSGPVEGRVRIASPYRLRAARFDHVFVGSLQDGEFPRRDRGGDPFLSEAQRGSLGLGPRRDSEAEERYLFGVCLALPRQRLFLSYRDSDESGGAEARSPLLDDVRALLAPAPDGSAPDPVEGAITTSRDLARVVHPLAEAPSEDELARSLATHGAGADPASLLAAAGVGGDLAARLGDRITSARAAEAASRAPGPLRNQAVIEALASVPAYGGTTLEGFDLCSYRWFVSHELEPQPLDPVPDPLVQGGLMHAALERLYKERPGGDRLPRPDSLTAWTARGRALVAEVVAERELGSHPAERAMARRVERLLERFLVEESERETGGFEPWLLEAAFGEREESERPALELDGWGLHGAIDRVDRDAEGRAVVIDYKLAGAVTPREKFEEQAKLQLQLYLLAVAEHWGAEPVGGLYHPLRGTSVRRPRGVLLAEAAGALAGYGPYDRDVVDADGLEELLADSRRRAGEIVARMRAGEIRRDPGPRRGLRGHDACPPFCTFAPICRRDRAPQYEEDEEVEER
ncbi:MAG TPA: PD-(D/E)XK nuclease family protein [Solirubrobacterales bacterium]|nr:PD-(D/E)XK nuclease family protein [Solirubrobacterales bacterium]